MTIPPDEVSRREKIAYGCGDLSSNLMWGLSSSYLMFYYTDIYRIPPVSVAWILLIARIFDAFCDPAIGWFVDRRGGCVIPGLIRNLAHPFGITAFLCFLPLPLSPGGKILWAGFTYILFGAIYSCINTPYGALATMISRSAHDRVDLNSFRLMGCQIGQFFVASLTIPAITFLGGGTSVSQRQTGMAVFVFLLACIGSFLWRRVTDVCVLRYPPPPARHHAVKILATLFGNRAWLLCNGLVFQQFIGIATLFGFAMYYVRATLGASEAMGGFALSVATIAGFAGALVCPLVTRRLGVLRTARLGSVFQVCGYLALFLAGPSLSGFFPALVILALAQGVMSPLFYVLLATAIDASQARHGTGSTGLAYSFNTLTSKVSMGITGFLLALFLSYGHYNAASQVLLPETQRWITAGFIWLPLTGVIVQFTLLCFWPKQPEIQQNLRKQ